MGTKNFTLLLEFLKIVQPKSIESEQGLHSRSCAQEIVVKQEICFPRRENCY